jgi:hypothetical protein
MIGVGEIDARPNPVGLPVGVPVTVLTNPRRMQHARIAMWERDTLVIRQGLCRFAASFDESSQVRARLH